MTFRHSVFVSYSHKDALWLEQLRPHLNALARERGVSSLFWDDTKIAAGEKWRAELEDALRSAKVAILLISKHFLDSDFVVNNELPPLLAAAASNQAVIFPVIVSPCRFEQHPALAQFQSVNPPSKPLSGMRKVKYEWEFVKLSQLVDAVLSDSGTQRPRIDIQGQLSPAATAGVPGGTDKKPLLPGVVPTQSNDRWSRVVVQALPDASIQFQLLRDGSPVEHRLPPPQRRLADQLTAQCLQTVNPALARALFELLVPNDLKLHLFNDDGTILILDSTTARYPWELLHDSASGTLEPVAARFPIFRQTVADRFIPRPQQFTKAALVVGEPGAPESPWTRLYAAAKEAEGTGEMLRTVGFEVNEQIRTTTAEVVSALFARPYDIVHIAGHGVYDYTPGGSTLPLTGALIGDDMFFTAAEVAQLRVAPELVFLNGSYLGSHVPASSSGSGDSHSRFATSLPDQFAMIGSRAVIAPGGIVDDLAAGVFAAVFYYELCRGQIVGDAVLEARKRTYALSETNTWSTYLGYGDPTFRLQLETGATGVRYDDALERATLSQSVYRTR